MDCCLYMATVLCLHLALTALTSVRTEPRATSAEPEEKKTLINERLVRALYNPDGRHTYDGWGVQSAAFAYSTVSVNGGFEAFEGTLRGLRRRYLKGSSPKTSKVS